MRSSVIVQGAVAAFVCAAATVAAIADALSGEALAAVYTLSLGYVFGVGTGVTIAQRES